MVAVFTELDVDTLFHVSTVQCEIDGTVTSLTPKSYAHVRERAPRTMSVFLTALSHCGRPTIW